MIHFTKEEYKKYAIGIAIVIALVLIEWMINPPFFKTKDTVVTQVDKVISHGHYPNSKKIGYVIHYSYALQDGTILHDKYKLDNYLPLPKVGDKQITNVRVTMSEGEFRFGGHVVTLIVMLSLLFLVSTVAIKMFEFMATRYFLYLLIATVIALVSYVWQTLHQPPTQESYLENFRVKRFASAIGFDYRDDMSSYRYIELARKYREDLRDYYKPLSEEEQKIVWENYIKIYKLQYAITIVLLIDTKEDYSYSFDARSYKVDAHFTKRFSQPFLCENIEVDFTHQPDINLDMKDSDTYSFIKNNFERSYKLLELNREFANAL